MEKILYTIQRANARIAAPIMRATGFRFSKASRDNKLLNLIIRRVDANLWADGIEPGKVKF